jgi:hypothetical protein
MLKVSATRPIIPRLLYLSGVTINYESGRSSSGGFGYVHFGKYRGVEVAVKMLYANDKPVRSLFFVFSPVFMV